MMESKMKALIVLVLLVTAQPAWADVDPLRPVMAKPGFWDRHHRIYACSFPVRHPKAAWDKTVFPIMHPLQFGKACEHSGANGMLGFLGGAANIGTTAILGARKF